MPATQSPKPQAAAKVAPDQPPLRWGTSAAAFYARLEDEVVTVHFLDAAYPPLCGRLVGVDQYDVFLEVVGATRLICKHAIRSVTPGDVSTAPCGPPPQSGGHGQTATRTE